MTLLPLHLTSAGSLHILAPVTITDGRLGLDDVLPGSPEPHVESWAQLAHDAGARMDRWEFRWDRIEAQPDAWQFSADDAAVQTALRGGLGVLGILIGTPRWAADSGQPAGNGVPKGLFRSYRDPANVWAGYVRHTVQHFRGRVSAWEIWNEPDVQFFWAGSPLQFFRLLKVAYLVIHHTDPQARVVMAGMVVPNLTFVREVLAAEARDPFHMAHHGYFDAVAWHGYGPARGVYTNIQAYKALLAGAGYGDVPLWVTEDGFPASDTNGEARQAAFILETVAYALAAGADRVLIYRESDSTEPKSWGVLTATGSPRQGYVALQVAAQYYAHTQAAVYDPGIGVERFTLYQPHQRITVLWNRGLQDREVHLSASSERAGVVDWQGNVGLIPAQDGLYDLHLPGATYNAGIDAESTLVGGPPVLMVENNSAPTGLTFHQLVPALPGDDRRLLIYNPGWRPMAVRISAVNPLITQVLHLPPHAEQSVDLDLLAGNDYSSMYIVASQRPVQVSALSSAAVTAGARPARRWYLAGATRMVTLATPLRHPVSVLYHLRGMHGKLRGRGRLWVPAWPAQLDWALPPDLQLASISFLATARMVVQGAVPKRRSTWYALQARGHTFYAFNPNNMAATLEVVGAQGASEIRVRPHATLTVVAQADVLEVTSDRPVVLSGDPAPVFPSSTLPTLQLDGMLTHVVLYNPAPEPAHLRVRIATRLQTHSLLLTVPGRQVVHLAVRRPSDPARAVQAAGDLPVVAAATP